MLDLIREKEALITSNSTVLPDSVFDSLTPIVLIRHPALVTDSIYRGALELTQQRAGDEDFSLIASARELGLLFDYFKDIGRRPIVVDGDDLLWRTSEMSSALCKRLGIDAAGLSDTWAPVSEEQIAKMNPLVYMLTKDIQESSGIQRPHSRASLVSCNILHVRKLTCVKASGTLDRPSGTELNQPKRERGRSTAGGSC